MNKNKAIGFVLLFVALSFIFPAAAYAINWRSNFDDSLQTAKKEGKPLMVDFYTDWCGWCKKLDSDTYSDRTVRKLAEGFICVKVDADKERELVSKYGVNGYPTVIFFDSSGNIVNRQVGYAGPADFALIMKKILPAAGAAKKPAVDIEVNAEGKKSGIFPAKMDFVYNGYIESADGEVTAQINYYGETLFVTKGDAFKSYKVISVDKDKLVLEGKSGQLVMEFKRPVITNEMIDSVGSVIKKAQESLNEKVTVEDVSALINRGAGKTVEESAELKEHLDKVLMALGTICAILLIVYIYFCLCLQFIAVKTDTKYPWLAWIPLANIFLMCSIGKIRFWWILLLLVPIVNVIVDFFMWFKVIKARNKPGWLLILMILPLINYIVMGYLAFSRR